MKFECGRSVSINFSYLKFDVGFFNAFLLVLYPLPLVPICLEKVL